MRWKAWLEGHDFDLQDLAALFRRGNTQVARDGEGYYLASTKIDDRPDNVTFYEAAQRVLQLVNGIGRAHSSSFRPVSLNGSYDEGERRHVVVSPASIEIRVHMSAVGVVVTSGGEPVSQPPAPGPNRIAVASEHPDIAEALAIMSKPEPLSWVELYKVYEIVRSSGALHTAAHAAGLTPQALKLFMRTANHPEASGLDARHARSREEPPTSPMPLEEARQLISQLMTAWIDSLSGQPYRISG